MDHAERESPVETVIGLSESEATDVLVADDDTRDPEFVRTILDHVTEDGRVTEAAVDETVTDASMVLSTAETRVELASMALSEAEETASDVADIDTVRTRLDAFDEQVSAAEARVADVGKTMRSLSRWRSDDRDLYDLVTGLRDVTSDAQHVQRVADDAQTDLEAFERWVSTPAVRSRALAEDVDVVGQSVESLARAIDELEAKSAEASEDETGGDAGHEPADGDDGPADAAGETTDAGDEWFDATLRREVASLLVADTRAELADLREMATRASADTDGLDELAQRLDELDACLGASETRLDELARPSWTARYGDRVSAAKAALSAFDPPVPWGDVQATLDEHRTDVET